MDDRCDNVLDEALALHSRTQRGVKRRLLQQSDAEDGYSALPPPVSTVPAIRVAKATAASRRQAQVNERRR